MRAPRRASHAAQAAAVTKNPAPANDESVRGAHSETLVRMTGFVDRSKA